MLVVGSWGAAHPAACVLPSEGGGGPQPPSGRTSVGVLVESSEVSVPRSPAVASPSTPPSSPIPPPSVAAGGSVGSVPPAGGTGAGSTESGAGGVGAHGSDPP